MFKARFTFGILVAMLLVGLIGCSSKGGGGGSRGDGGHRDGGRGDGEFRPGGKRGPGEARWDRNRLRGTWGPEYGILTYADFGVKFRGGRPAVEHDSTVLGHSTVHIATAKPDPAEKTAAYRAF